MEAASWQDLRLNAETGISDQEPQLSTHVEDRAKKAAAAWCRRFLRVLDDVDAATSQLGLSERLIEIAGADRRLTIRIGTDGQVRAWALVTPSGASWGRGAFNFSTVAERFQG
jgi:hypothetical protein